MISGSIQFKLELVTDQLISSLVFSTFQFGRHLFVSIDYVFTCAYIWVRSQDMHLNTYTSVTFLQWHIQHNIQSIWTINKLSRYATCTIFTSEVYVTLSHKKNLNIQCILMISFFWSYGTLYMYKSYICIFSYVMIFGGGKPL